jgi:hypothetical protein
LGAYLAARSGDNELAANSINLARDEARASGYPNLTNMLAIAQAESARATGKTDIAISLLKAEAHNTEMYLTHVALRDAYITADRITDAADEASWLANHRGRAYEESNSHQILQPLNVAESDLALLHEAELSSKLGKKDTSAQRLADFRKAWPNADQLAFLSNRLSKLPKP